jgi:hypothetical protein
VCSEPSKTRSKKLEATLQYNTIHNGSQVRVLTPGTYKSSKQTGTQKSRGRENALISTMQFLLIASNFNGESFSKKAAVKTVSKWENPMSLHRS